MTAMLVSFDYGHVIHIGQQIACLMGSVGPHLVQQERRERSVQSA